MTPPTVTFVVHEARRSGPPLYALGVLGWLAAHTDLACRVVLLEDGPLRPAFAALARTEVWRPGAPAASALLADADLVYVNTAVSSRALRTEGLRPPVVVTHVHELEVGLRYWLPAEDHAWMVGHTDRFLVGPDVAADNLVRNHGVPRAKIGQVPYFVPPGEGVPDPARVRDELGAGPGTVLVGACGAREWRKAPDLFAYVAHAAVTLAPELDLRFVWVGSAPPTAPHWDEAADLALLGLGDRLQYVDDQVAIDDWLAALDLYALTSREDDFPLACLTAAAHGVPVVTFDGGGMADFVTASGGGRVVPYPRVEALAAEVVALARDAGERSRAGAAARREVDAHHRLEHGAEAVARELNTLVAP